MNAINGSDLAHANLVLAWIWILCGFLSGMGLGLKFHDPNWWGGYTSHKRRLYRLGHISFFGLGAINLLFYLTVRPLDPSAALQTASIALAVGALTMPVCCVAMAHRPKLRHVFAVPVISLLIGAGLTTSELAIHRWNLTEIPPGAALLTTLHLL